MKQTNPFFFLFLLFSILGTHAQTSPENLTNFTQNLQKQGFDKTTITKIKNLITTRDQAITTYENQRVAAKAQYPISLEYDEINNDFVNKQFSKSLTQILTLEQFKTAFTEQLKYRIEGVTDQKMAVIKQKYKLSASQELELKNLVYQNTLTQNIAREYYNYNGNLSWNKYSLEKLQSFEKERVLMQSFGLFYTKDAKTDYFVTQLKQAKIDDTRINLILKALQTQQEEQDKHGQVWLENDQKYLIYFHDAVWSEESIRMEFRSFLQKTLTQDEFKAVFIEQLQPRIDRETNKELATNLAAYTLTPAQTQELKTMILAKTTEKTVVQEYYTHSWELANQKLRAVEYRHEKAIREWLQTQTQK